MHKYPTTIYIYIQYIQYYIYNQRNIMYTSKCNIQYQSIPCVSLTASMACVCVCPTAAIHLGQLGVEVTPQLQLVANETTKSRR